MPSVQNSEIPFNRSAQQTFADPVPNTPSADRYNYNEPVINGNSGFHTVRSKTQLNMIYGMAVIIISVIIISVFLMLIMSSTGFRYDNLILDNRDIHIVLSGETLSTIADEYGTSVEELFQLNRETISDINLIHPGQELQLPSPGNRER